MKVQFVNMQNVGVGGSHFSYEITALLLFSLFLMLFFFNGSFLYIYPFQLFFPVFIIKFFNCFFVFLLSILFRIYLPFSIDFSYFYY